MNKYLKLDITPATFADYPTIQKLVPFYIDDLSRECGFLSNKLNLDFKIYFDDPTRKAYLVKVYDEVAGFVLIWSKDKTNWNMGEFFILAKFQRQGIGKQVAHNIGHMYPGFWEVSVIPENKSALIFWTKTISEYTDGNYSQETKTISKYQSQRTLFTFNTYNSQKI